MTLIAYASPNGVQLVFEQDKNTDLSTRSNFPPLQGSIAKWNNQKVDVQIMREALEMKVF